MTVLTNPFSSKKDKLITPLVSDGAAEATTENDVEGQNPTVQRRIIIFPFQVKRVSVATVLCLLILALLGVIFGKLLYLHYMAYLAKVECEDAFNASQGLVRIPLQEDGEDFQENMQIDRENKYETIDVPNFTYGRNGRFIHDFNTNYTGIVDLTGNRCFVMPLDRNTVLPPTSLYDLVHKMWDGYYKVNTQVVRETMKVVLPPITDTSDIGQYIASECQDMTIYKLEKYVSGVVKRSANPEAEAKFGQFAGNGILELNIVNLDSVMEFEKDNKHITK
ncbi:integral membrane protein 2B [Anthonomus grandis grandis]|uniref:integral membrane protein 2B n=1 Tax=Anthonomus grandis grandis TaxID=2921223 RepID=UPI0021657D4B|nr:integral membrane protein 2B [Anthonomus grandis grandis]